MVCESACDVRQMLCGHAGLGARGGGAHLLHGAPISAPTPFAGAVLTLSLNGLQGGNGPHSGIRNSSFALATMRTDGFAGLKGSGTVRTQPLLCTGERRRCKRLGPPRCVLTPMRCVPGATLIVTADVLGPQGSVKIGAVGLPGVGIAQATPLTSNVTATKVGFKGGGSFAAHVGKNVTLEIELVEGMVYTVGFA